MPGPVGVPTVTIHSSWRGIIGGFLGAGLIAAGGTYGVIAGGFRLLPAGFFVTGWILVAVMAFDFPVSSTFDATGVVRRMVGRRQRFQFRDTDRLSRTRPKIIWTERRHEHGGLVLVRSRRRYLLVDRPESGAEYDAVVAVVEVAGGPGNALGASRLPRPSDDQAPTWLYRRRHWWPDSSDRR